MNYDYQYDINVNYIKSLGLSAGVKRHLEPPTGFLLPIATSPAISSPNCDRHPIGHSTQYYV